MSTSELAQKYSGAVAARIHRRCESWPTIIEFRPVNPEDMFMRKARTARGLYWIRSSSKLPDDPLTQLAGAGISLGLFPADDGVAAASEVDHVEPRHDGEPRSRDVVSSPCRADEWLLVDSSVRSWAARVDSLAAGLRPQRQLVASVAQEGLVRPISRKIDR